MRDLKVVPANEASWDYLRAVFGTRGDPARCWCQRYKMAPGESWTSVGASRLALRLREQTRCRDPGSDSTTGLVGVRDREGVLRVSMGRAIQVRPGDEAARLRHLRPANRIVDFNPLSRVAQRCDAAR